MSTLTIRIRKGRDGPNSLVCQRADGSLTMQHHPGEFFPVHDLTHYAVETVLGHERGFYGLVAAGWDLSDFGTPWPRGKLPNDVDPSELIVNALSLEFNTGEQMTAAELLATVTDWYEQYLPQQPVPATPTDEQLAEVRQTIRQFRERWEALSPGETMELPFPLRA